MGQTTFALLLFLFPLAYSPGPGNIFFAANGARFGFRLTMQANIGYHIATWGVTMVIGFGFIEYSIIEAFLGVLVADKISACFHWPKSCRFTLCALACLAAVHIWGA